MRYFLELSYRGTSYNGWQRQTNAPSVQQTIEQALSAILRAPIEIIGAGRTDTGVHASYYVAHFDVEKAIEESVEQFCYHLNAMLPHDIAIQSITPVANDAHARFDAVEREYTYYILPFKEPFTRKTTWQYYVPLDVERMNRAAAILLEYNDFTAFSKLHSANKTNICTITQARWRLCGERIVFTISADRFLRNMVRAIVAALVDVGRGKIDEQAFREIIESRDRSRARGSAPSQGLFLSGIAYHEDKFKPNLK